MQFEIIISIQRLRFANVFRVESSSNNLLGINPGVVVCDSSYIRVYKIVCVCVKQLYFILQKFSIIVLEHNQAVDFPNSRCSMLDLLFSS